MKLSSDDHKYRQWDAKQVNDQKPSLFAVVVGEYVSNDEGHSQKENEKYKQAMNRQPNPLIILGAFLQLKKPPTDLIDNGRKIQVIGVALNIHQGS